MVCKTLGIMTFYFFKGFIFVYEYEYFVCVFVTIGTYACDNMSEVIYL